MFCGLKNHASLFGSLMCKSGFGGCNENVTCLIALMPTVKFGLGEMEGSFSGVGLGPLLPLKKNFNVSIYQNIFDNAMLANLVG